MIEPENFEDFEEVERLHYRQIFTKNNSLPTAT